MRFRCSSALRRIPAVHAKRLREPHARRVPMRSARGARPGAPRAPLLNAYHRLYALHGPQRWWPAESPFEVMVGAVLTQNTAWSNVERAIANLKKAGALVPETIISVHPRRLATWLKPSGYFNVKAKRLRALCRWLVNQGGVRRLSTLPTDVLRPALLSVNGVGPETADDILLYAFHRPVFVIDAYTRRLFARLGEMTGDEDYETLRAKFEAVLPADAALFNEYHALIVRHAKDICRSRPRCDQCKLVPICPTSLI